MYIHIRIYRYALYLSITYILVDSKTDVRKTTSIAVTSVTVKLLMSRPIAGTQWARNRPIGANTSVQHISPRTEGERRARDK